MAVDVLYFANPMCSWCYGFGPSLRAITTEFAGEVRLNLALGSLREDTEPLRADQKAYLRQAWTRVGEASGQTFHFDLLERDDFVYDTRPACRAVAAVRASEDDWLSYLGAIQTAFYLDNRDVTAAATLADIAEEAGVDGAPVEQALADPSSAEQLVAEYQQVARMGVSGYPTVLAMTRPKPSLVTVGFQPPKPIIEAVRGLLKDADAPVA